LLLLIWGRFEFGFGDALFLAVLFLFPQPLAEEVVCFPAEVQVPDGFPLGAAPLRRTEEFAPGAGFIAPADLLNQGQQICIWITVGHLLLEEFLDHRFNEVLLTAVEGLIL
jgi:hypothetical protein